LLTATQPLETYAASDHPASPGIDFSKSHAMKLASGVILGFLLGSVAWSLSGRGATPGETRVKIVGSETFLANAGLRNYLFIRLRTDNGLTGIGEATLEWQEKTVATLLHEWVVRGESFGRMIDFVAVHRWACGR
jgi:hypothetical protein